MFDNNTSSTAHKKSKGGSHPVAKKAKRGTHPASEKKQTSPDALKREAEFEKLIKDFSKGQDSPLQKLSQSEVKAMEAWLKEVKWEVSKTLLEFIGEAEDIRLKIYDYNTNTNAKFDAKGNIIGTGDWTIGIGHKLKAGEIASRKYNTGITRDKAYEFMNY